MTLTETQAWSLFTGVLWSWNWFGPLDFSERETVMLQHTNIFYTVVRFKLCGHNL